MSDLHNGLNIVDIRVAVQQVAADDAAVLSLLVILMRDNAKHFPLKAWDILMILWDGKVIGGKVTEFWKCCGKQDLDFVLSLKKLRGENLDRAKGSEVEGS